MSPATARSSGTLFLFWYASLISLRSTSARVVMTRVRELSSVPSPAIACLATFSKYLSGQVKHQMNARGVLRYSSLGSAFRSCGPQSLILSRSMRNLLESPVVNHANIFAENTRGSAELILVEW